MQAITRRLEPAIEAAESATAWLLQQNDPALPAAGSVEFLMMHGRLAGGWMMVRTALAASALKQSPDADSAYLDARITLARYYAEHVLPLVESASTIITEGAETTVALDISQL